MDTLWVPIGVALTAGCVGAITDAWKCRVHNVLTVPLMITGMSYHAICGGWPGITSSAFGLLFGFSVLILPWLLGLVGAGDVKLMAGIGGWLGMPYAVLAFVISSLAAGIYAIVLIIRRGKVSESLLMCRIILWRFIALRNYFSNEDLIEELSSGKDSQLRVLPFGTMVPLGVAGVVVWFWLFS